MAKYAKHLTLQTHDGIFHADDVLATALLSLMADDFTVIRSRQAAMEKDDRIIYDVLDTDLDHHSPACKEANGTHRGTAVPYAACGLVWDRYYREILSSIDCPPEYFEKIHDRLERSLIIGVDALDNGYDPLDELINGFADLTDEQKKEIKKAAGADMTFTAIIRDFNPTWNGTGEADAAFMDAVDFARDIVLNRIDSLISSLDGEIYVLNHISYSGEHMMIMEMFAPWEGILHKQSAFDAKAKDVWYVISPGWNGEWHMQCALIDNNDRTSYRHPLPEAWLGLRDEELRKVTGVATAGFCHASGFMITAGSQADAIALARIAAQDT